MPEKSYSLPLLIAPLSLDSPLVPLENFQLGKLSERGWDSPFPPYERFFTKVTLKGLEQSSNWEIIYLLVEGMSQLGKRLARPGLGAYIKVEGLGWNVTIWRHSEVGVANYSEESRTRLLSCHKDLQAIFNEVIELVDVKILEGHRDQALQDLYFSQGKTKETWPNSKHNKFPSLAIDVAPSPIDWSEAKKVRFYFVAGVVKAIAANLNISIRWGGDWDSDLDFFNQSFIDLPHFELVGVV